MTLNRANWKAILIAIAVLLVSVAAAYFVGRGLERHSAQKQLAAATSSLASANSRAVALQSRVELFTANVWVYRASTALDNRNFGVANEAMTKAVEKLSKVDANLAGVDPNALATVQKDASALKIAVATNLEPQRAQLLRLAASVTELAGASDRNANTTR